MTKKRIDVNDVNAGRDVIFGDQNITVVMQMPGYAPAQPDLQALRSASTSITWNIPIARWISKVFHSWRRSRANCCWKKSMFRWSPAPNGPQGKRGTAVWPGGCCALILFPKKPWRGFRVPESYRLVAVIDGVRRELAAGESVALPEGVLVFEGLTTWMGYKVYYDPTLSWMLAASLLAVASLAVFCWRRFGRAAAGRSA